MENEPKNYDRQERIKIDPVLLAHFDSCKKPLLPGMSGLRFPTLDEYKAKGGSFIQKIPFNLENLEAVQGNLNPSITELWGTLRRYEDLYWGLQCAKRDGLEVDELINETQELGFKALTRAAEILLSKVKESYNEQNGQVDESKGVSPDQFREIVFWFKDFFKNMIVSGHEIPANLETTYYDFLRILQHPEEEIQSRSRYAREEAEKILNQ